MRKFINWFKDGRVSFRRAGSTGPDEECDTGDASWDPPLREKGSDYTDKTVSFSKRTPKRRGWKKRRGKKQ